MWSQLQAAAKAWVWMLVLVLLRECTAALPACAENVNNPLVIGVVDGLENVTWTATFDTLLNKYMTRFACSVVLKPLMWDNVTEAADAKAVDFLFLDPGLYSRLQYSHSIRAIGSIQRNNQGAITQHMGGVFFRAATQHTDLHSLADLDGRNLIACAVHNMSFTGWLVQRYELFAMGLDAYKVFSQVVFSGTHEKVVEMVMGGACDVGLVKTFTLELLNDAYDDFVVIGPRSYPNFPLRISTPLYNEWPLAALPHVSEDISSELIVPLLAINQEDAAALADQHAGFVRPYKYTNESNVMFQLDLVDPSLGLCAPGSTRNWTAPLTPCQKCSPGRYKDDGWDPDRFGDKLCHACEPGKYTEEVGAPLCKACPPGKITYSFGNTGCQDEDAAQVYEPIESCNNKTVKIGVLAEVSVERTEAQWTDTFERVMNEHFNRFQCSFQMVILDWHDIVHAVERHEIDFVFADPGLYTWFQYTAQVRAVASVVRVANGFVSPWHGGVIFRSSVINRDVNTLQDLAIAGAARNLTACPVDENSLAGWNAQKFEFFKAGLDVDKIFSNITFTHSHDVSAALVANGECDVGFVRTETLERLALEDVWEIETFSIINLRPPTAGFVQASSTVLYAEWPLAALPHVAEELVSLVPIPLMAAKASDDAAVVGLHAGFTTPRDYSDVSNIWYQLDLMDPVLGLCAPGSTRNWTAPLTPCQKCSPGRYKDDGWDPDRFGDKLCHACEPGKYTEEVGAPLCKVCPPGKITYSFGQLECLNVGDVEIYEPIHACEAFPNRTAIVGVLYEVSVERTEEQWKPTFEGLMNDYFTRYRCYFKMVALDWHEIVHAIEHQEIDFVFADSGFFVWMSRDRDLRAVASVLNMFNGRALPKSGGVIFRSSVTNHDLNTLQDLATAGAARALSACPVDEDSLVGWNAQQFEFFKAGLDVNKIFSNMTFTHSHDVSAALVANGECDVGFASTETLERLAIEDVWEIETFYVINRLSHAGFLQTTSTDLYSNWPFAVMPHVAKDLADVAAIPLLCVQASDEAAVVGKHAGFSSPLDYSKVSNVRYQLGLEESGACAPGSTRDRTALLQPCVECEAGRFNTDGFICRACQPGQFSDKPGAVHCDECKAGKTTSSFGATFCIDDTDPLEACAQFPNRTLTIGMLVTDAGLNETFRLWRPTFEDTLNEYMHRYVCFFKLKVFERDDLVSTVAGGGVDMLFTEEGLYSVLARSANASAFASVVRFYSGKAYAQQGGTMFRASNRHTGLNSLEQLASAGGLTACVVGPDSFNGWIIQWYEFFLKGLDVRQVFTNIISTQSHEESVHMVMRGECDIGMAASLTLSDLISAEVYQGEDFAIINAKTYSGFTQQISTHLYHTWPLSALPHVAEEIYTKVSVPLRTMQDSPAAALARHAGFEQAGSYANEANVMYQLNLMDPAISACAPGSSRRLELPLEPCVTCSTGRANAEGLGECRACQPGKYSSETGSLLCSKCGEGTTTYGFGATRCEPLTDALVYDPIEECANFTNKTLKVGVQQESALDADRWRPTFETELNNYFNRYQCYFQMVMLTPSEIPSAIATQAVDLLFCDPGKYAAYRGANLKVLSSILRIFNGQLVAKSGGVVFRKSTRHVGLNAFQGLSAVTDKLAVCTHSQEAFGSYTMQAYELFKLGMSLEDFGTVVLTNGKDDTVSRVFADECDLGMVPSETLENLIIQGTYRIEDFAVIDERSYDSFHQLVSTDLYPEWPLLSLEHVPAAIADVVSLPLLALRDYSAASMAGQHAGFTPAFNYGPVFKVRFDLALEADGLRWWIPCIGASTIFGALFSKTYRLYKIFRIYETKQKVPQAIRFKDTKVAALVLCFELCTGIVLALYFIIEPPFYELRQHLTEGQDFFTYIKGCHISKIFVPLNFSLYTILLSCQSWLAYRVRKLPTIFNESQLIAWLLYNTVFVGLVGIMVDFMLDDTMISSKMMVRSVAILLGAMTPVFVLFVPKFMEIYRDRANESKYSSGSTTGNTSNANKSAANMVGDVRVGATSKIGNNRPGVNDSGVDNRQNKMYAHKSNKSNLSYHSALDDNNDNNISVGNSEWQDDITFEVDSDVAGDEMYIADFSKSPLYPSSTISTQYISSPSHGPDGLVDSPPKGHNQSCLDVKSASTDTVSDTAAIVHVTPPQRQKRLLQEEANSNFVGRSTPQRLSRVLEVKSRSVRSSTEDNTLVPRGSKEQMIATGEQPTGNRATLSMSSPEPSTLTLSRLSSGLSSAGQATLNFIVSLGSPRSGGAAAKLSPSLSGRPVLEVETITLRDESPISQHGSLSTASASLLSPQGDKKHRLDVARAELKSTHEQGVTVVHTDMTPRQKTPRSLETPRFLGPSQSSPQSAQRFKFVSSPRGAGNTNSMPVLEQGQDRVARNPSRGTPHGMSPLQTIEDSQRRAQLLQVVEGSGSSDKLVEGSSGSQRKLDDSTSIISGSQTKLEGSGTPRSGSQRKVEAGTRSPRVIPKHVTIEDLEDLEKTLPLSVAIAKCCQMTDKVSVPANGAILRRLLSARLRVCARSIKVLSKTNVSNKRAPQCSIALGKGS
eukprot:g62062.t1